MDSCAIKKAKTVYLTPTFWYCIFSYLMLPTSPTFSLTQSQTPSPCLLLIDAATVYHYHSNYNHSYIDNNNHHLLLLQILLLLFNSKKKLWVTTKSSFINTIIACCHWCCHCVCWNVVIVDLVLSKNTVLSLS